jgi:hypothetical protein
MPVATVERFDSAETDVITINSIEPTFQIQDMDINYDKPMFHGYGSRATEKSPITQTAKKMFL